MSGLLGVPAGSITAPLVLAQFSTTPENTASYLASSSAKDCYIDANLNRCYSLDNNYNCHTCSKSGFVPVGLAHGTAVPSKAICPVSRPSHMALPVLELRACCY
jgi:hypothetical protein